MYGNRAIGKFWTYTVTQINKTRIVLFGGATGDPGKYSMTDATYVFTMLVSYSRIASEHIQ